MKKLSIHSFFAALLLAIVLPACSANGKDAGSQGPDINLQMAVITGNLEAVKQHIEAGTDLNAKDPLSGSTALITAATFNKIEIVKALIAAGADLSLTNTDGSTALHSAAFFCRVEIVQVLINAEADKTIRNNFGATARESVLAPFSDIKPVYEMMQNQLGPMGMNLDMSELEKTRPVIAMMLE